MHVKKGKNECAYIAVYLLAMLLCLHDMPDKLFYLPP